MPHHSILRTNSALVLTLAFSLQGCGDKEAASGDDGTGGGSSGSGYCGSLTPDLVNGSGAPKNPATALSETPVEGSACNAVERNYAIESAFHTDQPCVEVDYSTNPPCTGTHYGVWADYIVYDEAIPRGFWVHSLEHGAVALLYSCSDCDDEVAAASNVRDEAGYDPLCVAATGIQVPLTLLTPDPRLDTAWAAASWGYTLTADCFEPDVFRAFIDTHRGHGGELACGPGTDVSQPR